MTMVLGNLLDLIGNTQLARVTFNSPATVYAKLEYLNPSLRVKDRSAYYMIEQAEKQELLKPGGPLLMRHHGIMVLLLQ